MASELRRMRLNTDVLACYMLDNDIEAISEAQLRVVSSFPGGNAAGRQARFQVLVANGFWKVSKTNRHGRPTYIPMIHLAHRAGAHYPASAADCSQWYPEVISRDRLRDALHGCLHRQHSVATRLEALRAVQRVGGQAGRVSEEPRQLVRKLRDSSRR